MFHSDHIVGEKEYEEKTEGWDDWITVDYGTANLCVFLHIKTKGNEAVILHVQILTQVE